MRFCNATLRCWHFPTYKYVQTKPKHWAHMITMAMGALATEKLQLQKLFAAFIYHQPASWEGKWTAAWGQFGLRYASLNTITSASLCWVLRHLHSIPNHPLSHHIWQPMHTDKSPMHLAGGTSNTNWVVSSCQWHHCVPCPLFFWLHLFALVYTQNLLS